MKPIKYFVIYEEPYGLTVLALGSKPLSKLEAALEFAKLAPNKSYLYILDDFEYGEFMASATVALKKSENE